MMDTSRLMNFLLHLPHALKKKLSHKEIDYTQKVLDDQNFLFASMTNISIKNKENHIFDSQGCLLFIETTQSNLSLFNISCDSLLFNENNDFDSKIKQSLQRTKHNNSFDDLYLFETKKNNQRSTMYFSEDILIPKTNTLQRWQGLELLNTYA